MRSWLQRWSDWLPLSLLGLTILALFYRLLFGQVIFWGLPSLQFYPWREFALSELAAGRLPLWNPYNGAGAPLLANYQSALLYPPNWLSIVLPGPQTIGFLGILHVLLAGIGMWLLTGRLQFDSLGRGIATLAYPLSSTLIARFGTVPMLDVASWLPWLILAVDGVLESTTLGHLLALAIVSAFMLLAGHAQWTFYCFVLACAYVLWRLVFQPRTRRAAIRIILGGIAALALACALSAAQLLPTAEYMMQSQRASGVDQAFALNFSYAPLSILTLFNANFFGNPGNGSYAIKGEYFETTAYIGILPAFLAILGAVHYVRLQRRRKRQLPVSGEALTAISADGNLMGFFAIVALISLFLAFGQYTPLYPLLYRYIPTFNLFQAPARWLLLTVFSLAMLAGQATALWEPNRRAQRNINIALVGSLILILSGLGAQVALANAQPIVRQLAQGMAVMGVLALITSVIFATQPLKDDSQRRQRRLWHVGVLVFVALDLWWANTLSNPTVPANFYQSHEGVNPGRLFWPDPGNQQLPQIAFETYLPPNDYRVAVLDWRDYRRSELPDMNMLDHQSLFNNFDPLRPDGFERFSRLLNMNSTISPNLLVAAGITQVMGEPGQNSPVQRVWIVPRAITVANADAAEKAITAPDWNPAQSVVIESGDAVPGFTTSNSAQSIGGEINASPTSATIVNETPLSLDITVNVPAGGGFLVVADGAYPGWKATLDGQPTPIYRANLAFRAVAVSEGQHHVLMNYQPQSWQLGVSVSAIGLLMTFLVLIGVLSNVVYKRYRLRKRSPESKRLQE